MDSKGIIFIHGAGLGNFVWNGMKGKMDIPAMAVDFPNRKKGAKANLHLHFKTYVDMISRHVEKLNVEKLIFVVHSIGGCVGLKVADIFKDKLAGFVGISAAIPKNGNSFISCLPFPKNIIVPLMMKFAGTRPSRKIIEEQLCNDLTPEQRKMVVTTFTPESMALYIEKCEARIPETNRMYIKLTDDKTLSPAMQEKMIQNLKPQQIATIQSGHLAMLSHPEELARLLNEFSKEV